MQRIFNAYICKNIWRVQIERKNGEGRESFLKSKYMRQDSSCLGTIMYQNFIVSFN